ncbi:hypothetical protein [Burkholderia lata]|uniref:hypothetical protein n=1 Tax=Burkholderia lata (strain ATCC 17760 / DSM 23089 / LMG 22485 / NCIMB 9086 / R18194 / 383) TaxID=482957 RepID=UPI0015834F46|nr:hypothetical protein [Burkholderia lata]
MDDLVDHGVQHGIYRCRQNRWLACRRGVLHGKRMRIQRFVGKKRSSARYYESLQETPGRIDQICVLLSSDVNMRRSAGGGGGRSPGATGWMDERRHCAWGLGLAARGRLDGATGWMKVESCVGVVSTARRHS